MYQPRQPLYNNQSNGTAASHLYQPDESAALSLIQHLDRNDLQAMIENDSKLNDLIEDMPQLRRLDEDKKAVLATNQSIAEFSLSQQPRLEQLRAELSYSYDRLKNLNSQVQVSNNKLQGGASNIQSLDTVQALLQTEAAKSEEESEELVDSLFDQKLEVDTFVTKYIELRILAHNRRIKSEKMAELMRSQPRTRAASSNPVADRETPPVPPRTDIPVPQTKPIAAQRTFASYGSGTSATPPLPPPRPCPYGQQWQAPIGQTVAPYPMTQIPYPMMPQQFIPR